MAKKSKPSASEEWDIRDNGCIHEFANELILSQSDEKRVMMMLRLFLAFGSLEKVLGVSKIYRHRYEVSVGGGRIDLLLFHKDGGVTIVEAKSGENPIDISRGIGQLCMYSTMLPYVIKKGPVPAYVNLILAAPIEPENSLNLMSACKMAGVRFVHLATHAEFKKSISKLAGLRDGA